MKKSEIKRIITGMRISIPKEVENELLKLYVGRESQYTAQDICEQMRKRLRPYEKTSKSTVSFFS